MAKKQAKDNKPQFLKGLLASASIILVGFLAGILIYNLGFKNEFKIDNLETYSNQEYNFSALVPANFIESQKDNTILFADGEPGQVNMTIGITRFDQNQAVVINNANDANYIAELNRDNYLANAQNDTQIKDLASIVTEHPNSIYNLAVSSGYNRPNPEGINITQRDIQIFNQEGDLLSLSINIKSSLYNQTKPEINQIINSLKFD